jgi:uncharacterized membrane protein
MRHLSFEGTIIFELPTYVLALTASFLYALGSQFQHVGVHTIEPRLGTMLSIGASAAIFWLAAPFYLNVSNFLIPAMLIFVALGFIRPALSANLSVAAIRYIGPTLTETLSATTPFFAAAFGILILGELLTWQIALGTAGIIIAVLALTRQDKTIPSTWPLWALALPIGAAVIRSLGHGFSKIGMQDIPDPYFAGLVAMTFSFLLTAGLHIRKGERTKISFKQSGTYWFLAAGAVFCVATFLLNVALLKGDIITIIPIVSASPVFTMLLSIFIFKRETISLRVLLAVVIVIPSVVLIALSK